MADDLQCTHEAKRNELTVAIFTSYTLQDQTLDKVTSAKYIGVEITENFHWEKHIQATAAKTNKVSAFAYRNLKGCIETSRDA